MKKLTMAAGAAVLAMGATALFAAPDGPGGSGRTKLDADGNGSVTLNESRVAADRAWTRLDANRDGKLDPADRAAQRAARFDKIDANGNASIDRAEFEAMHAVAKPGREGKMGRRGLGHHGIGGGRGAMMALAKLADSNSDGAVSRAEYDAGIAKHFGMIDVNGDGAIIKEERKAARQKMRAMWQAGRPNSPATTTD